MMTWMTRGKFGASHGDLDNARLSALMANCQTVFDDLTGVQEIADQRHPILGMWRGYEYALGIYAMMANMEMTFHRGFADQKVLKWFYLALKEMNSDDPEFFYELPPWWGDPAVLLSHRSNLIRHAPDLYRGKWKQCPTNWPLIWPQLNDTKEGYSLYLSKIDKKLIRSGERSRPDAATLERVVNWP